MALLLGMAMLPAGAIAMQVGLNASEVRRAAIEETLERRAVESIAAERGVIDEVRELVRVLATSPALQNLEARTCRTWLSEVIAEYDYVEVLSISNDDGRIICSVPEAPAGFIASRTDLRQRAQARDEFTLGFVEYGPLARQPVLGALEPLRDANGRRIGFVGASITVNQFQRLLERDRDLGGARTAIVDATGRIIAETAPSENVRAPSLPTTAEIRNNLGPEPALIPVDGGSAVVVPVRAPDLYAVISWAPDAPAWQRWAQLALAVAAPILIWLLAVAAGWFAIEVYVARPLSTLETMARRFARGDDVTDSPELANAPVEIRSLRRTLAAMAKTLRGREARLVEALGEERALLREVHHRVKNNLQMVASLLNIQARGARDDSEAWGLARAHDRVQLLALVHQRIYASGEVREVRLDDITAEMARQLLQARGAPAKGVTLQLHVHEARTDADRAVPMAFLIGEAISSALDALTDAAAAQLDVYLMQEETGEVRFAIVGDAEAETGGAAASTRLIDAFARQLGARIGRRDERPFLLWVCIPPQPDAD